MENNYIVQCRTQEWGAFPNKGLRTKQLLSPTSPHGCQDIFPLWACYERICCKNSFPLYFFTKLSFESSHNFQGFTLIKCRNCEDCELNYESPKNDICQLNYFFGNLCVTKRSLESRQTINLLTSIYYTFLAYDYNYVIESN